MNPVWYMSQTDSFEVTEAYDHCHSPNHYDDTKYCTNTFLNGVKLEDSFNKNCEG